jgi:DNA-binding NarL/FixJ family response regulator
LRLPALVPARPVPQDRHVPWTVLIADDNARFRARARQFLEAEGHVVVAEVGDGASVGPAVRRHRPDVVLLDVRLPDESGLDVAARLAAEARAPAVVLTSTYDAADFGDRVRRSGARGFVPKSELSAEALSAVIR